MARDVCFSMTALGTVHGSPCSLIELSSKFIVSKPSD
jgi:hypothetical protein